MNEFQKLEEAGLIISSINNSLDDYLELLDNDLRTPFLKELETSITSYLGNKSLSFEGLIEMLNKYPQILKEFYPEDKVFVTRFSKEDVVDEPNIKKKIAEIENEIPVLAGKINEILTKSNETPHRTN